MMNWHQESCAKLTRPVLRHVYQRKRLFRLLDDLREYPVLWITGPPGCGKTSLVSSYIDENRISNLWYHMDKGDLEPANFFYYMGLCAGKKHPESRKRLPVLTPEYLPALDLFSLRFFEKIFNRFQPSGCLVFDNYQEVSDNTKFQQMIRTSLRTVPQNINIIFISRGAPPKELIYLQANRLLSIIGWEDLRLTRDETEQLIRLKTGRECPRQDLLNLHELIGGWAAGLTLIVEVTKRQDLQFGLSTHLPQDEIFDYFAEELFDHLDQYTQRFLLKTAYLPIMTEDMAQSLTRIAGAAQLLSRLIRNNFFITKHIHKKVYYKYHHLFGCFLKKKASEILTGKEIEKIQSHCAALLLGTGEIELVAGLYLEMGNWDAFTDLVLIHAQELIDQGRHQMVLRWLNAIPEARIGSSPWLLFWKGVSMMASDQISSCRCFEKTFHRFDIEKDIAGKLLSWAGAIEAIVMGFENFHAIDGWIILFKELRPFYEDIQLNEIKCRVASGMFKALALTRLNHPDIEAWAEQAIYSGEKTELMNNNIWIYFQLSHIHLMRGAMDKAERIMLKLNDLKIQSRTSPLSKILAEHGAVMFYHIQAMEAACFKSISKAYDLVEKTGIQIFNFMTMHHESGASMDFNQYSRAEMILEKMGPYYDVMKAWDKQAFHMENARLALIQNKLILAQEHATAGLGMAEHLGYPPSIFHQHYFLALAKHGLGNQNAARAHLDHCFDLTKQMGKTSCDFILLMAQSHFAFKAGHETAGLDLLRQGLSFGRQRRITGAFWDIPMLTAQLCAKALECNIETSFVRELIRKRQLILTPPPVHIEIWPWKFRIHTFGSFRIVKEDQTMSFPIKIQRKPLDMLKVLIAMGGNQVAEDQLADSLWPDADGDNAHRAFATTLYRLRKLLGHPETIKLSGQRLSINPSMVWVDVNAFKFFSTQADDSPNPPYKTPGKNIRKFVKQAIDIYQGAFLPGEDWEPHIIAAREGFHEKFSQVVLDEGKRFESQSMWEQALMIYQMGLDRDNVTEEFYKRIMVCHQNLGQPAKGLDVYRRCRKVLTAVHGTKPSSATTALAMFLGNFNN